MTFVSKKHSNTRVYCSSVFNRSFRHVRFLKRHVFTAFVLFFFFYNCVNMLPLKFCFISYIFYTRTFMRATFGLLVLSITFSSASVHTGSYSSATSRLRILLVLFLPRFPLVLPTTRTQPAAVASYLLAAIFLSPLSLSFLPRTPCSPHHRSRSFAGSYHASVVGRTSTTERIVF